MQVEQVKMMRILSYLHFSLCQWQVHCSIDDAAVSLCTMTGESQPIIFGVRTKIPRKPSAHTEMCCVPQATDIRSWVASSTFLRP